MITEPLLRDNILSNIYNNFAYSLSFNNMYIYGLSILLILVGNWFIVRLYFNRDMHNDFVPNYFYKFNIKQNLLGMTVLLFSFLIYCIGIFSLEISIFNNFDSMTINYIDSLKEGIKPIFDGIRFTPLQAIDLNIVFGLSNNPYMISWYVILKQALCLYLMYKAFCFINVNKRLLMISLINLLPCVFEVNNIIFPEQNLLIFLLLSIICLISYKRTNNTIYLLFFILFMNLGIYTKETLILFYAGMGLYLLSEDILTEKITMQAFFSPVKTTKMFPVEYLMFCSMFVYFTCWYMLKPINNNSPYLIVYQKDILNIIQIYCFDLIIFLFALITFIFKITGKSREKYSLINEGGLLGCFLLTFIIVFYLRISNHNLSYYVYLSTIFCLIYIFINIHQKIVLVAICCFVLFVSGFKNYNFINNHHGRNTREIAEYITNIADKKEIFVYLFCTDNISNKWWKTMAWSSALKYASPNAKLVLKTDLDIYKYYIREENNFFEKRLGEPEIGDYVLVNKVNNPNYIPPFNSTIVYENKTYKIYHLIEDKI